VGHDGKCGSVPIRESGCYVLRAVPARHHRCEAPARGVADRTGSGHRASDGVTTTCSSARRRNDSNGRDNPGLPSGQRVVPTLAIASTDRRISIWKIRRMSSLEGVPGPGYVVRHPP